MMNAVIDNLKGLGQRCLCSMKVSALRLRAAGVLAGVFAFVWWCVLYPELCFPQDTYEAVYETGEENEEGNFRGLLQAEEEQVIVKIRLLECLERFKAE